MARAAWVTATAAIKRRTEEKLGRRLLERNLAHGFRAENLADVESLYALTFITVDGAWDINWVEGPPNAADLTR